MREIADIRVPREIIVAGMRVDMAMRIVRGARMRRMSSRCAKPFCSGHEERCTDDEHLVPSLRCIRCIDRSLGMGYIRLIHWGGMVWGVKSIVCRASTFVT